MTNENDFDAMTERLRAQGLPVDTHPEGSLKGLIDLATLPPYDDTAAPARTVDMRHAVLVGSGIHCRIEATLYRVLKDHPEILLADAPESPQLPAKFSVCADDFLIKKGRAVGKSTNTLAAFEGFLENERAFRAAQSARPTVSVGRYRSDKERARAKAAKKSRRKNRK